MSRMPNFPILPPPPPPPRFYSRRDRWCKKIKKILIFLGISASGISLAGIGIFGAPTNWFPIKSTVTPLYYPSPSRLFYEARAQNRIQATQALKGSRLQTSSPDYLPNSPFGGYNMRGNKPMPTFNLTVAQAARLADKMLPSLRIEKEAVIVPVNGRKYTIYLFEYKDKKIWHPYGNVMTYKCAQDDVIELCKIVKRKYPDYALPDGYGIALDHSILKSFAIAMKIPRSEGAAVFAPSFANNVRTNDTELVEPNSNFDWRLSDEEQIRRIGGGLDRLTRDRLHDAISRNFLLYTFESKHVKALKNIDFTIYLDSYPLMEDGYERAIDQDLEFSQAAFGNAYNIAFNEDSSLFAFYNELLVEGMKRDISQTELYSLNYFTILGKDQKRLIPEYLIFQMFDSFIKQYQVSKQLQAFVSSPQYKKQNENFFNEKFRAYETISLNLINNCERLELDIDTKSAKKILRESKTNFKAIRDIDDINIKNTFTKQDVYKLIFSGRDDLISLGDFYNKSNFGLGRIINLKIIFAEVQDELIPGEKNVFFLERINNRQKMKLTETPYQKNIAKKLKKWGGKPPTNIDDDEEKGNDLETMAAEDMSALQHVLDQIYRAQNRNMPGNNPGGGNPFDGGGGGPGGGGGGHGDDAPGDDDPGDDEPGDDQSGGAGPKDGGSGSGSGDKTDRRYGPPLLPKSAWKIPAYKK